MGGTLDGLYKVLSSLIRDKNQPKHYMRQFPSYRGVNVSRFKGITRKYR